MECFKCKKIYNNLSEFKRHINRKTPCNKPKMGKHMCNKCGKIFRDTYNLTKHLHRINSCNKKTELDKQIELYKLKIKVLELTNNNTTNNNITNNNITNNITNNTVNINISPLTVEHINFDEVLSKLTIDHIRRGPDGIADILMEFIEEKGICKYICVNLAQLLYKRLCGINDNNYEWKMDNNHEFLKQMLYPRIITKMRMMCYDYEQQHPQFANGFDEDTYELCDNTAKLNRVQINVPEAKNYHDKILHCVNKKTTALVNIDSTNIYGDAFKK